MRNLLQILIKYHAFFIFLILEVVAMGLVINKNKFQQCAAFRLTNTISSAFYNVSSSIYGYFNLKETNNQLSEENTKLKNYIVELENQLETNDSTYVPADNNIEFIEALVINNSTNRPNNYMIINKGRRDGLHPDMAVVGTDGIVGIISTVSNQFSIVETLLNNKSSISARLSRSNEVGQLKWDGISSQYANLEDVPRHVNVNKGDTVVTSGYSTIFPRNIVIGIVDEAILTEADATYNLKIKLSTNFKNIRYVQIINNKNFDEIEEIEKKIEN